MAVMKTVLTILLFVLGALLLYREKMVHQPEEIHPSLAVSKSAYQNEIIVRTINNLHTSEDVDRLITRCKAHHISIISVAFKQDEDDEIASGELFYPSRIATVAKGYEKKDILKELIQKAHRHAIMIKAWIPQFHDQVAYKKDPSWGMMAYHDKHIVSVHQKDGEYFVNPLHKEVQDYERSIIKEIVSRYDIDGVVLDWIRFDDYAMDLSDYTRAKFHKKYGYDPLSIDFEKESEKRREWNRFRTQEIAAYIHQVAIMIKALKPTVQLGVYVLSPEWREVGQDPALFYKDIDFISPMCYYDDWEYPVDWIYGPREDAILLVTKQKIHGRAIVPVFDVDWTKEVYADIFEHLKKSYPKIDTVSWFLYGKWDESAFVVR